MRELYFAIPKKVRLFAIVMIALLLLYFVGRFLLMATKIVPDDFMRARQQASVTAQDIVGMSKESSQHIAEIAALNNAQNYSAALRLTENEIERNRQIRDKAIELSAQLQTMTIGVSNIQPKSSGELALEAVSTEVTLIGHLLIYTDYLNQLLQTIRDRIADNASGSSERIPMLLQKINDEVIVVNALNDKFNEKMGEFDRGL